MGAYSSKGGGAAAQTQTNSQLYNGESAFVSFAPSALHPNGEPIIAQDQSGGYRYLGTVPNWTQIQVDRNSPEYKQIQRDYNMKWTVHKDGSVTVQKGGLYPREKKYKTQKEFRRDVEKRIDSRSRYDDTAFNNKVHGKLTQIEAENLKTIARNNSKSQALKKMNAYMKDALTSATIRYRAIQDVKTRFRELTDQT